MRRSAVAARDGGAGERRGSRYAAWCLVSVVVALSVAAVPAVAGDDYTWEQYEGCRDPKGTEAFVKQFPDSARAAEGRACLERWKEEEDEWRKVADCGDVGRVEAFLERYPEGRYAEQARECVVRRRDSDVKRLARETARRADDAAFGVLRGGSWSDEPGDLRSAARYEWVITGVVSDHIGFRVARTLD